MPVEPAGDGRITVHFDLPAAQVRWLRDAERQSGQTQSELMQQAVQLLRKASSYKNEIRPAE